MKTKILSLGIALLAVFTANAQVDRTKAPEAGPAPKIELGDYESFVLANGLQVFVVENHKLPRISFQLTVDYDPIFEGNKAGYVSMAGSLLSAGTTNRTKEQIDEGVDFIGARFSTFSSGMFGACLTKHQDELLDIMTDVLYNPSFPQEELDKGIKQTLSGLASAKNEPNSISSNVTQALNYGLDHPYGEQQTEETVGNINLEDCKNFYNTYWKPNISYLVIVGDIKAKKAKKLVEKYFAQWERAEVPSHTYPTPQPPAQTRVALSHRSGAVQSVINVTYPVEMLPGSEDVIKASVMNSILGGGVFSGRLMQNLREDKGYTYGCRSSLRSDELVGAFSANASVRNEVTDSSVYEILYELNNIAVNGVTAEELTLTKNVMNGSFARSLESPQTIARFALNIARYDLPADYYATYLQKLSAITVDDINATAKKYILPGNANIVVVGNAMEVGPKLEKFGKVTYYDNYGNVTDAPSIPIPEGVTVNTVLDAYFKALGGNEALNKVKDITSVVTVDVPGMPTSASGIIKVKSTGLFYQKIEIPGMGKLMEIKYDGKVAKLDGMAFGGPQTVEGEEAKDQFGSEAVLFPELNYVALGYKLELESIANLETGKAYQLKVTSPAGDVSTEFYDVESGLKVRVEETEEVAPGQEMTSVETYTDYKAVNGVMFPHQTVQYAGPQVITFKSTSIEVNTGLKDSEFK